MNRHTVVQLRQIAKERGLRGYSKLRKAELIEMIQLSLEREEREREESERLEREEFERSLLDTPIPIDEIPESQKILKPRKVKTRKRLVKRVKKKVNKPDWEQWMKDDREEFDRSLLDTPIPIDEIPESQKILKPTKVSGDKLKDFKANIADLYKESAQRTFEVVESKSALKGFAKTYKIKGQKVHFALNFLQAVKPTVINFLLTQKNIKIKFVLRCNMSKTNLATGETEHKIANFNSSQEIVFEETDREELYQKSLDKMLEKMAEFLENGSGWKLDSIESLDMHTVKYTPLNGSSYIKLPPVLESKKAIINMKNKDEECFKWCVTRALNPVADNAHRVTKLLREQAKNLDWSGLKFPLAVKNIHRFERLNPGLVVNVYIYEGEVDLLRKIKPLRVRTDVESNNQRIHLLLICDGEKQHYCLIKDLSRLVSNDLSKRKNKKFICERCLNYFGSQKVLDVHIELCQEHEAVREKLPEAGTFLSFQNYHKKMDLPFVIYADFESVIKPIHSVQPSPLNCYTEKKQIHIPVSFCYYVKCSFDDRFSKLVEYTAKSEDEDVAQMFVDMLEKEVKDIYKKHPSKKMIFTDEDLEVFENSWCCWLCGKAFTETDKIVRDHCHYTGKFRGAAHNKCNLRFRRPKFTPVVFHNLANYDAHLFVRNLGVSEGDIN